PRVGNRGAFFVCSNAPFCEHKEEGCRQCGGQLKKEPKALVCQATSCGEVLALCPRCNGVLVQRKGKYGDFWGCTNYRGKNNGSCGYTSKRVDIFPRRKQ